MKGDFQKRFMKRLFISSFNLNKFGCLVCRNYVSNCWSRVEKNDDAQYPWAIEQLL